MEANKSQAMRECALPMVHRTCEWCGGQKCPACAHRGYIVCEDARIAEPIFGARVERRAA